MQFLIMRNIILYFFVPKMTFQDTMRLPQIYLNIIEMQENFKEPLTVEKFLNNDKWKNKIKS